MGNQRQMGKAGYLFMGLLIAAFVLLVIVFAFQTYFLVNTLFPSDNVFMKVVTVFSFDGCCIIYAGLELFYHFKWKHAKTLTGIMWGLTFLGSLICTVAYMNLSSDHLLHAITDSNILVIAYAVVTAVFSGDIVAITYLIKNEYIATQDWKYGKQQEQKWADETRRIGKVTPSMLAELDDVSPQELQIMLNDLKRTRQLPAVGNNNVTLAQEGESSPLAVKPPASRKK